MKKLLLALSALAATNVDAALRPESEMMAAARSTLTEACVRAEGTLSPVADLRLLGSGETYRIYGDDDLGFAVVSTDDRFTPVLGYSLTRFDAADVPCGLQWWLHAVDESMQQQRTLRKAPSASADNQPTYPVVENFIPSTWGQGDPFNWLCPLISNSHAPSGCVATALSQVMYYYRYPAQGTGKGAYYVEPSKTRIPEEIKGVYEWDKMLDSYKGQRLTDELRQPVATLLHDAGLGVLMNYGSSGSGAFSDAVAVALADNFSYNPLSLRHYFRQYFSTEEWMALIAREIKEHRPVYYAAADEKSGGHAFFFSGMDSDGKVYVNWGWDGVGNGYYEVSMLTPTGILGQAGTQNYSVGQHLVIGIKANAQPEAGEHYESHVCLPDSFLVKRFSKKLQCSIPKFYSNGFRAFNGVIGLYFVPADGSEPTFMSVYDTKNTNPIASGYGDYISPRLLDVSALAAGSYRVYVAANDVRQNDYELCRSVGGVLYYPLEKAEDGTLSVGDITAAESSLLDGISDLLSDQPSTTSLAAPYDNLTRVYDASGRLVYSVPCGKFNLWDVRARGLLIVKEGRRTWKVVR